MSSGWLPLDRDEYEACCEGLSLSATEQAVLVYLLVRANHQTGDVEDFTLTSCARAMALGERAGPQTVARFMRSLERKGAVRWHARRGSAARVEVLVYGAIATTKGNARISRYPAEGPATAPTANYTRVTSSGRANSARTHPFSPADSRPEEEGLEKELASSSLRDWNDDELQDLVRPLIDMCARTNRPAMTNERGVLVALAPYMRAQVLHAVRQVAFELQNRGKINSPFGHLVTVARAGRPEYFPPAQTLMPPAERPPCSVCDNVRQVLVETDAKGYQRWSVCPACAVAV